jgi:hypothetical protein
LSCEMTVALRHVRTSSHSSFVTFVLHPLRVASRLNIIKSEVRSKETGVRSQKESFSREMTVVLRHARTSSPSYFVTFVLHPLRVASRLNITKSRRGVRSQEPGARTQNESSGCEMTFVIRPLVLRHLRPSSPSSFVPTITSPESLLSQSSSVP